MDAVLISMLLRLLAPEPAEPQHATSVEADAVFLPAVVGHTPESELMPTATANVAEFLSVRHSPIERAVGPEVFMSVRASTATWQPSRSAAEFMGPRSNPVWMVPPAAVGSEAFMLSRDSGTPQSEVFMPTRLESTNGPGSEVFMVGPMTADPSAAVFMSTAR